MNLIRASLATLLALVAVRGLPADEYQAEAALRPRTAVGPDGMYVVVTSDREHIVAIRHAADGTALGNPIIVDARSGPSSPERERPEVKNHRIAMDRDGSFVVAWESAGESHDVHFRLFDKDGNHIARRSYSNRLRPGVSMTPLGEFLLTTKDFASRGQLVAQFFDPTGNPKARSFPVTEKSPQPWSSASAIGADHLVFVAYEERERGSSLIRAVAIDRREGDPVYRVGVSEGRETDAYNPAVAAGPDGKVAIVWEEIVDRANAPRKSVILAVLDAEGSLIRPPASITPSPLRFRDPNPKVRFDTAGKVIVSYSAHAQEVAP